ncbi:hypothetical protein BGZ83_009031 [Gryganskiella cystojenkinii]|nr:hypothetical protein BGZ83_009031 [Gryganskiella cystojenkinii]
MKFFTLLSAFACASVAFADYGVKISNNSGAKSLKFTTPNNIRPCICLASTQTATIQGVNGGDIKVFQKADCTGNYQIISPNGNIKNAQWVNSISFGPSGSSRDPGTCPDWYP